MSNLPRLISFVVIVVASAACLPTENAHRQIAEVQQPHDLEQLDAAVREQFSDLWSDLNDLGPERRNGPEAASAWGKLGQWFDVYRYDSSAALCYDNARFLDPTDPRWPFFLGLLAEDDGDLDAARGHFMRASELAPGSIEARVRLGNLALRRQDADRAREIFSDVLTDHPDSPGALFGEGQLALVNGDPQAAVDVLERLSLMQPDAAQVHYALGRAWRQLGNEERAVEHIQKVPEDNLLQIPLILDTPWEDELKLMDRGARTLTRLGVSAFRRGDHASAVVLLGRAVAADPVGPEKRINFGVANRETGRWRVAEEQLNEAVRLSDDSSELRSRAHLELGRLLMIRGRKAEAERNLKAALAIDPHSLPVHLELGRLYHAAGRLEDALTHYALARQTDRALGGTRFWHGALLVLLDRYDQAIESVEEDLAEIGDNRELRLLLARLLSAAPDAEHHDLKRARQMLADSSVAPDVFYAETAAMVEAASGNFDAAVAWQRAAVEVLGDIRPRTSAQTARRRLILYQRGEACRNPWEVREAQITVKVQAPPMPSPG